MHVVIEDILWLLTIVFLLIALVFQILSIR